MSQHNIYPSFIDSDNNAELERAYASLLPEHDEELADMLPEGQQAQRARNAVEFTEVPDDHSAPASDPRWKKYAPDLESPFKS